MRKKLRSKWLWISIFFSIIVLVIVLATTVDESTIGHLFRMDPTFLLLAFGLRVLALGVWAFKIQKMAESLGYQVPFLYCLNTVNANLFAGAITPAQAGGEPVRIHELYAAKVKLGDATALVITERLLDAIILIIAGIIAVSFLGAMNLSSVVRMGIYLAWGTMLGVVILFIYSAHRPDLLKRLLKKGVGCVAKKWDATRVQDTCERIDREVDNFHASLALFATKGRAGLVWGSVCTAAFWSLEFLVPSFLLLGLGEKPYFAESFLLQIVIAIIMMVPTTPGGSGVAEVSAYSLYALLVKSSIAGVFVVLWRALFYYFNIALGLLASIPILRREINED
ncbi:MAG: flippase-like domain-containing protein [Methanomicrobiales archaeon]|nr:flippase-like domain-containing protein [Methanomicrobiales archaeon]